MKWIHALFIFIFFNTPQVVASPLSEVEIFHRCYKAITGRHVPLGHAHEAKVRNNQMSGSDACIDLFDNATLSSTNDKIGAAMYSDTHLILQRFYALHVSWFGTKDFSEIMGYDQNKNEMSEDVFDTTEPALALTYVLFSQNNEPYSSIFKGSKNYVAIRELDPEINATRKVQSLRPTRRRFGDWTYDPMELLVKKDGARFLGRDPDSTVSFPVSTPSIQVGELMGIQKTNRSLEIPNYNPLTSLMIPGDGIKLANSESALSNPDMVVPLDVTQNRGGGILGMQSYQVLNWGLDPGFIMDGSVQMSRRFTEAWLGSLMCRDLPLLRASDVTQHLVTENLENVAGFRRSPVCLRCHTTLDPAAAAGRNFVVSGSEVGRSYQVPGKTSVVMGAFHPSIGESSFVWPKQPDPDFHLKTPVGQLNYRSVTGQLVSIPLNGLESLGQAVASQIDPYQCAAKRYFEHFTGINIELYDYEDPDNQQKFELEHSSVRTMRGFIEDLGQSFKSHQSLKRLAKEIIKSPYFKDSNYEVESGGG